MDVNFLDTYALIEISRGNPRFKPYFQNNFIILDLILAEIYSVLLRDQNEEIANLWCKKLESYIETAPLSTLINAVKYRKQHKSQNLSFFDCVGYIYSKENNLNFVTGDEQFENKEGVIFIKKD